MHVFTFKLKQIPVDTQRVMTNPNKVQNLLKAPHVHEVAFSIWAVTIYRQVLGTSPRRIRPFLNPVEMPLL